MSSVGTSEETASKPGWSGAPPWPPPSPPAHTLLRLPWVTVPTHETGPETAPATERNPRAERRSNFVRTEAIRGCFLCSALLHHVLSETQPRKRPLPSPRRGSASGLAGNMLSQDIAPPSAGPGQTSGLVSTRTGLADSEAGPARTPPFCPLLLHPSGLLPLFSSAPPSPPPFLSPEGGTWGRRPPQGIDKRRFRMARS